MRIIRNGEQIIVDLEGCDTVLEKSLELPENCLLIGDYKRHKFAQQCVHPTGLNVAQKEEVRQMIQSALDTGSA